MSDVSIKSGTETYIKPDIKNSQLLKANSGDKPVIIKIGVIPDIWQPSNLKKDESIPNKLSSIVLFETTSSTTSESIKKIQKTVSRGIGEAMMGGALVKGSIFGLQYTAAGIGIGLGYNFKLFNFVPEIAKKAPVMLGSKNKLASVALIGLSAGLIGTSIGLAKGSADGFLVGITDSKEFAMTSLAVTTALTSLPMVKINKVFGYGCIGLSAITGSYYGAKLFEHTKSPKDS